MADNMEAFFGDQYSQTVRERATVHGEICELYSHDWTVRQEASGLSVPRYLAAFSEDVRHILHKSGYMWLVCYTFDSYSEVLHAFAEREPGSTTARMVSQRYESPMRTERLYKNRVADELGFPFIYYFNSLHGRVFNEYQRRGGSAASDMISSFDIDDEMRLPLRASLDWKVLLSGRYDRDIDTGVNKTVYASSTFAMQAMRGALDNRLLMNALKDRKSGSSRGVELLAEHASTPNAREVMLGWLALRESGSNGRSKHRTRYYPIADQVTVSEMFKAQSRAREAEREEEMRQRRAAHKQRIRDIDDEFNRMRANTGASYTNLTITFRVARIVSRLDPRERGTLERIGLTHVADTIRRVDELRESQPDISVRRAYAILHGNAHANGASDEEKLSATIFAILVNDDFGKDKEFDF